MNDDEILKAINKYKKMDTVVAIIYALITAFAIVLLPKLWLKILGAVLIFVVLLIVVGRRVNKRKKILFNQMDPRAYHAISNAGKNKTTDIDNMQVAYYFGEYDKVISICTAYIDKQQAKGKKCNNFEYLQFLCFAYFESGDYDSTKKILSYIDSIIPESKVNPKSAYSLVLKPQFDFFTNFIDGRYDKCIAIEDVKNVQPEKVSNTFKSRISYYTALAYYYNGDIETAVQMFKDIIQFCPNLNYSKLAQYYIDSLS
jgi:tetratricopeptide (TPR) repeat protein